MNNLVESYQCCIESIIIHKFDHHNANQCILHDSLNQGVLWPTIGNSKLAQLHVFIEIWIENV